MSLKEVEDAVVRLPGTVLYDIFVAVEDLQPMENVVEDLRNFACVCSAWSHPASRVLDRFLALQVRPDRHASTFDLVNALRAWPENEERMGRARHLRLKFYLGSSPDGFVDLIRATPLLRRLDVYGYMEHVGTPDLGRVRMFKTVYQGLSGLRHLGTLTWSGGVNGRRSLGRFLMGVVSKLRVLHTLNLAHFRIDCTHDDDGSKFDWGLIADESLQFPPVRQLSLTKITYEEFPDIHQPVLCPLVALFSKLQSSLEELELRNDDLKHLPARDFASLVCEAGKAQKGLQSLRISTPGIFDQRVLPRFGILEAIAQSCPDLRRLHIQSEANETQRPRDFEFFQGYFTYEIRAPLEVLSLWIPLASIEPSRADRLKSAKSVLVNDLSTAIRGGGRLREGGLKRLLLPKKFRRRDQESGNRTAISYGISALQSQYQAAGVDFGYRRSCRSSRGDPFDEDVWDQQGVWD